MKGPFERLKYDLRRLWECPLCRRRERTDGAVTSRFCTCPGKGAPEGQRTSMKLLEEAGHRTVPLIKFQPPAEPSPTECPADEVLPTSPPPGEPVLETDRQTEAVPEAPPP